MMVLVTYDVSLDDPAGKRRLRRIARTCQDFGQRVQFSVFECLVTPEQWVQLKGKLEKQMDHEKDSLRYYLLGTNWKKRVEHVGAKSGYDPEGLLLL